MLAIIEYFTVGFLGALIGSMVGLGGGFLIVPFLLIVMSFLPATVAGTSILVVFVTAVISVSQYARHHLIDWKLGGVFAGFSIPGAVIGALITGDIQTGLFMQIFAADLLLVAGYILFRPSRSLNIACAKQLQGVVHVKPSTANPDGLAAYAINLPLAAIVFFLAGMLSGLVGVGGGSVMVPGMLLVLDMPAAMVASTSMLVMVFNAGVASIVQAALEHINWTAAILLSLGAIVGSRIGPHVSVRLNKSQLTRLMSIVLLVTAVTVLYLSLPNETYVKSCCNGTGTRMTRGL